LTPEQPALENPAKKEDPAKENPTEEDPAKKEDPGKRGGIFGGRTKDLGKPDYTALVATLMERGIPEIFNLGAYKQLKKGYEKYYNSQLKSTNISEPLESVNLNPTITVFNQNKADLMSQVSNANSGISDQRLRQSNFLTAFGTVAKNASELLNNISNTISTKDSQNTKLKAGYQKELRDTVHHDSVVGGTLAQKLAELSSEHKKQIGKNMTT
jgi:hypothetical protein